MYLVRLVETWAQVRGEGARSLIVMANNDRVWRLAKLATRVAIAYSAITLSHYILRRTRLASKAQRRYAVSAGRGSSEGSAPIRRVPTIAFRGSKSNKRAYVKGTSLDVWEIVEAYKYMGPERLRKESDLSEDEIAVAISYYKKHPAEIEERIEDNRRPEEEWRKLYPDVFAAR